MSKYKDQVSLKLAGFYKEDNFEAAKKLLIQHIRKQPNDYWLLCNYAIVLYELRSYKEALRNSGKAFLIEKDDPVVMNYYAAILEKNGYSAKAIRLWNKILEMDLDTLAYNEYGEGMKWAKSLQNDVRYNLGMLFKEKKNYEVAKSFFTNI